MTDTDAHFGLLQRHHTVPNNAPLHCITGLVSSWDFLVPIPPPWYRVVEVGVVIPPSLIDRTKHDLPHYQPLLG